MKRSQKLRQSLVLAVCAFILPSGVYAQNNSAYSPSPDSKALVSSIQNPVDYHTGVVNIQAPITTIQANGVSVPITLSYQTSGIKLDDKPTSVGLGWRCSSGGKITRIVKKYPDEKSKRAVYRYQFDLNTRRDTIMNTGWLKSDIKDGNTLKELISKICTKQFFFPEPANDPSFNIDMEPDIFYFEIPGRSGMFIIDHTGLAHTIPYQDISIDFIYTANNNNNDNYFIITDNGGNKYRFGTKPESRELTTVNRYRSTGKMDNPYQRIKELETKYTSTWWLDEVEPFSGEKVSFTYSGGTHVTNIQTKDWFRANTYELKDGTYVTQDTYNNYETENEVTPRYIREIKWSGGKITFSYSEMQSLAKPNVEVINNIKTFAYDNTQLRDIYLDYTFFLNGIPKLDAVREKFGNDMQYIYKFKYSTAGAPTPDSGCFFDHWGYYNGGSNYKDYMPKIDEGNVVIPGHNREPVLSNAQAYSITSIEAAGGLETKYTYQLNQVQASSLIDKNFGGLRISRIEQTVDGKSELVRHYTYTLPNGRSSGKAYQNKFLYYDDYAANQIIVYSKCINNLYDFGGSHMSYSRVTEHFPNGSYIVYNYDEGTDHEDPEWEMFPVTPVSAAKRAKMALLSPPTSYFWRRGLLTSQEVYDASGVLTAKTENQYSFGPASKVIECFVPYNNERVGFIYKWVSEPVFLTKTINRQGRYNTYSETTYEYQPERMLPIKISTIDSEGNTYETRTQYSCNYMNVMGTPISDQTSMARALLYMISKNALNIPIETINYKNGKILTGTLNYYRTIPGTPATTKIELAKTMTLNLSQSIKPGGFQHSTVYKGIGSAQFLYDPNYEMTKYYDEYSGNRLISSHEEYGHPESIVYGYGDTMPVAKVSNAVHSKASGRNQILYDSFEYGTNIKECSFAKSGDYVLNGSYTIPLHTLAHGKYRISYWRLPKSSTQRSDWEYMENEVTVNTYTGDLTIFESPSYYYDELRVVPLDTRITTCTYRPGIGKTSETDTNGNTTYYEYNKFGMLTHVIDNNGVLLKMLSYDN